jgi:hypothetical protein
MGTTERNEPEKQPGSEKKNSVANTPSKPSNDDPPAAPAGLRATDWKPEGIRSQRNQVTFRPSSNGILRSGKNANLPGGDGVAAAKDQTAILKGQGMPKHLEVYYDKDLNGFYIAPKKK